MSTNLLSKRLRRLQDAGLVVKRDLPPPGVATVYELDPQARVTVLPVLKPDPGDCDSRAGSQDQWKPATDDHSDRTEHQRLRLSPPGHAPSAPTRASTLGAPSTPSSFR